MGSVIQKDSEIVFQPSNLLALLLLVTLPILTGSVASFAFALFICFMGGVTILCSVKNQQKRILCFNLFFLTFSVYIVLVLLQWLDTNASFSLFSNTDNDHYMFWLHSEDGAKATTWSKIFEDTIKENIYVENGGYYLYIQTLGYIGYSWFDGNHIVLQYLGTAFPGIIGSVFVFLLIDKLCPNVNSYKYSLYYALLSPMVIECMGIHRDGLIALLYIILIYLWQAKDFKISVVFVQALVAFVLLYLRIEHGLFAFIFILLSAYTHTKKTRYIFLSLLIIPVIIYGSLIYNLVTTVFDATTSYYELRGEEALQEVNSGLGRYVYQLPPVIKQIVQVILVNVQFPPWVYLEKSLTLYGFFLGIFVLIINVFWSYIFIYTLVLIHKIGFRKLPPKLLLSFFIFLLFIVLNTSNLTLRRVVCVFPCLYIIWVYIKEFYNPKYIRSAFPKIFGLSYLGLCILYVLLKLNYS